MPAKKTARKATPSRKAAAAEAEMITVQSFGSPGYTFRANAEKYAAMHRALLKVLPTQPPGLTQAEMFSQVKRHLPQKLFPGGDKVGWWVKCVQLDQEAKRNILREQTKPLRWHRKKSR